MGLVFPMIHCFVPEYQTSVSLQRKKAFLLTSVLLEPFFYLPQLKNLSSEAWEVRCLSHTASRAWVQISVFQAAEIPQAPLASYPHSFWVNQEQVTSWPWARDFVYQEGETMPWIWPAGGAGSLWSKFGAAVTAGTTSPLLKKSHVGWCHLFYQ